MMTQKERTGYNEKQETAAAQRRRKREDHDEHLPKYKMFVQLK
jgi:hypothetical protein